MKKLIVLLFIASSLFGRVRHVAVEWNTDAVCLEENFGALTNQGGWFFSPWLHAYFQTPDWWVYHCDKGWLFPESDGNQGVWFYWSRAGSWVWTRSVVYPLAFDEWSGEWFNFCVKPE